jgi:hypothetical protein
MRAGFGLPCFAQKLFPEEAMRQGLSLLPQALRFRGQSVGVGCCRVPDIGSEKVRPPVAVFRKMNVPTNPYWVYTLAIADRFGLRQLRVR